MTSTPAAHSPFRSMPADSPVRAHTPALVHALQVALRKGAQLHVTDIVRKVVPSHRDRVTAEVTRLMGSWGPGTPASAPISCGQLRCGPGSERGLLAALAATSADLLVLDRHEDWASERLTDDALLARLVQRAPLPTLVVGDSGLIGRHDGRSHVRRVVIPTRGTRGLARAIDVASWLVESLTDQPIPIVILQIDDADSHAVASGASTRMPVHYIRRSGPFVNVITQELAGRESDLLVLPLGAADEGWNATMDILRLEALLAQTRCSILGVPIRKRAHNAPFGSGFGLRVEAVRSP